MQCISPSVLERIKYIQQRVNGSSSHIRAVTPRQVACVLSYPPSHPPRITRQELDRINGKLLIPLHPETILAILVEANRYDKLRVRNISTHDETFTQDNDPELRIAI